MLIGGRLGYRLLRKLGGPASAPPESELPESDRLRALFGPAIAQAVEHRTVIDFGCGPGSEAIELARMGAKRVIGLDIRPSILATARERAHSNGLDEVCEFTTGTTASADIVISVDAFEHFADPASILVEMAERLRPGGRVWVSFGPPWLHPLGGHLFSVFPWAHVVFTEKALIRWRSDFKSDGATRFSEVEGGLNQMTIRRFERLVAASPLEFEAFETVPIRRVQVLHNRLTREFFTSIVRCRLRRKQDR